MGRALLCTSTRLINVAESRCTGNIIRGKIFDGNRETAMLSRFENRTRWSNALSMHKLKMIFNWYWHTVTDIATLTVFLESCAFHALELSERIILASSVRCQVPWRWRMLVSALITGHRIFVDPHYIIRNVVAEVENNRWIFSHWDGTKFNEIRMLYGDEFSLGLKLM